jgi:hypothetical protein
LSAFEIAAPMPRVPPVTTATRAMPSSLGRFVVAARAARIDLF